MLNVSDPFCAVSRVGRVGDASALTTGRDAVAPSLSKLTRHPKLCLSVG